MPVYTTHTDQEGKTITWNTHTHTYARSHRHTPSHTHTLWHTHTHTHCDTHTISHTHTQVDYPPSTSHPASHGRHGSHRAAGQPFAAAGLWGDEATILRGSKLIKVGWVIGLDGALGWSLQAHVYTFPSNQLSCLKQWSRYSFQTGVTSTRWQKQRMELSQTIAITSKIYVSLHYYHAHTQPHTPSVPHTLCDLKKKSLLLVLLLLRTSQTRTSQVTASMSDWLLLLFFPQHLLVLTVKHWKWAVNANSVKEHLRWILTGLSEASKMLATGLFGLQRNTDITQLQFTTVHSSRARFASSSWSKQVDGLACFSSACETYLPVHGRNGCTVGSH